MSDQNFLPAILSGDHAALTRMYVLLFPPIHAFVRARGGSEADAKDLFQDAVLVIYQKARKPDFQLSSQFGTYFYGVCQNLWRTKQRKKASSERPLMETEHALADERDPLDWLQVERQKLIYRALKQLGQDCQRLLLLFFQKTPMEAIARTLNFASEGYARRRKHQCKARLIEQIKKDPSYQELLEE